jgi:hypothetical protein
MAGERMVNDMPEFIDLPVLRPRPRAPVGIGVGPVATVEIDHPKLGCCGLTRRTMTLASTARCCGATTRTAGWWTTC